MTQPLTPDVVGALVEAVRSYARSGDHEAAHVAQDELYERVLRAVADGHEHSAELAKMALEVEHIGFERWCA